MRDSLEFIFRQRFRGHESPVDPGAWDAIQGQLQASAMTPDGDPVNELFRERFAKHEMDVDPALWQQIGQQLGHSATVGATAGGGFLGWAAAGVGILAIGGGLFLFNDTPSEGSVAIVPEPTRELVVDGVTEGTEEQAQPLAIDQEAAQAGSASVEQPVAQTHPDGLVASTRTNPIEEPVAVTAEPTKDRDLTNDAELAHGRDVVEGIIEQITRRVEEEVRSTPASRPQEAVPTEPAVSEVTESTPEQPSPDLFMQNTFTPNGDGINDVYEVRAQGFQQIVMRVYSVKSNQLVFSTNTGEPWTGVNCEDGYYLVAVEARTEDGRMVTQGKVVWLNRDPVN